jgi:DHA1 family multidrug resistance protein-like MFS transporter
MDRSLQSVLIGTFTLRFSTGLTGAMLQYYLAHIREYHPEAQAVSAETVGLFAATFFLAELVLSPIFGILSDRFGHHRVMLWGPIFGAIAVVLTAASSDLFILGGTRWLEGSSTAASVPSILGFIAIATAGNEALRGRAASRFEGATLAGLGLGLIVALPLFKLLGPVAFLLNAVFYGVSLAIYRFGVKPPKGEREAIAGEHVSFGRYLALVRHSHVLLLAPTWIAVNASIGLWMSQSIFQLSQRDPRFPDQWLLRGFSVTEIVAGMLVIAVIFGVGILWWGNRFDKFRRTTIIGLGVFGGLALVVAAGIANHTAFQASENLLIGGLIVVALIVAGVGLFGLAGATPAAVGLLADVSEQFPRDRGAIMGLYSVFLAVGQISGSLIGGFAAGRLGMDGLLIATGLLLIVALVPLSQLRRVEHYLGGPSGSAILDGVSEERGVSEGPA